MTVPAVTIAQSTQAMTLVLAWTGIPTSNPMPLIVMVPTLSCIEPFSSPQINLFPVLPAAVIQPFQYLLYVLSALLVVVLHVGLIGNYLLQHLP